MGHSLRVGEWKPAETAGTHSQGALALIGAVAGPRRFDDDLLGRATFSGLLSWSAERAGMSEQFDTVFSYVERRGSRQVRT